MSNHAPSQLALLHRRHPVATNQIELSPLHLDALHDGTLDQCLDLGRIHPANLLLTHELIGKMSLGINPDEAPRWG